MTLLSGSLGDFLLYLLLSPFQFLYLLLLGLSILLISLRHSDRLSSQLFKILTYVIFVFLRQILNLSLMILHIGDFFKQT